MVVFGGLGQCSREGFGVLRVSWCVEVCRGPSLEALRVQSFEGFRV